LRAESSRRLHKRLKRRRKGITPVVSKVKKDKGKGGKKDKAEAGTPDSGGPDETTLRGALRAESGRRLHKRLRRRREDITPVLSKAKGDKDKDEDESGKKDKARKDESGKDESGEGPAAPGGQPAPPVVSGAARAGPGRVRLVRHLVRAEIARLYRRAGQRQHARAQERAAASATPDPGTNPAAKPDPGAKSGVPAPRGPGPDAAVRPSVWESAGMAAASAAPAGPVVVEVLDPASAAVSSAGPGPGPRPDPEPRFRPNHPPEETQMAATAVASTGAVMDAEHATEITLDGVLKVLEMVMGRSMTAYEDAGRLAAGCAGVAGRLDTLRAALAGAHNVTGARTQGALAVLVEQAQAMVTGAGDLAVRALAAAELAEAADTAFHDRYKPVQLAAQDAGLVGGPSARAHNKE